MGKDYPDYTDVMQIIGSDIMVPFDIQAAYIMMPVDLQAQYVTLEIDIVAQSVGDIGIDIKAQTVGNLAVNIAQAITLNVDITAQTIDKLNINLAASAITLDINIKTSAITLNVDITAQTVGNLAVNIAQAITLNVDITAQTVGNINIDIDAQSVGIYLQPEWAAKTEVNKIIQRANEGYTDYSVPAGKTLYIGSLSFSHVATSGEYAELNQMGFIDFRDQTIPLVLAALGGNGGGAVTFATPLVVPGGHTARLYFANGSDHTTTGLATAVGYEL